MGRSIVIYFSRKGENYWNGSMKMLEKGNTEIVAEMAAELTGSELFQVEAAEPYPEDYRACVAQAAKEWKEGARPEEFRRRIEAEHLEDLLTVELMDYRDLPKYGKTFDRVVSVGMVEHVGRDNYRLFMDCVKEMLPARRRSTTASSTFIRSCSPKGSTTSCPW